MASTTLIKEERRRGNGVGEDKARDGVEKRMEAAPNAIHFT